jgi:zinc protease
MKNKLLMILSLCCSFITTIAQEVTYEEYDLDNGLHVILHQDNTAPLVTTAVMYHVGGKDRTEGRTGMAHFFEHLLFEGTKNIEKGKWFEIVSSNGGTNNANTSQDRTYYYEVFPSNNLKLALWMESERMLHPIINQDGINTQNEVIKEEKRSRYDNAAYGKLLFSVSENLFKKHPYKDPNIGYMKDLDAATLEEFIAYKNKYYVPNNATLVVAGDIDIAQSKQWISDYFSDIQKGDDIVRNYPQEEPITREIKTKFYDPNIQIPATIIGYRTPGFKNRDAYVLDMLSSYLSDGPSSKLYKKMVDDQKEALQVGASNIGQEDYGMYLVFALPVGETTLETLNISIEEEIAKARTVIMSENDYQKLQNKFENRFVNSNSSVVGITGSLATKYTVPLQEKRLWR